MDVRFDTVVDGPGRHGEVIDIYTNDAATTDRQPFQHELVFRITVRD